MLQPLQQPLKTPEDIDRMRVAGRLASEVLDFIAPHVKPGTTLGDIGFQIQRHAEANGFSVVREFCGHGIGKRFHEEPQILHYGRPGTGYKLVPGMTFTIEPMINAGRRDIRQLADGWTIVTADHSLSAQWEHTVLVTEESFEILTKSAGTPPPPSFVESTGAP